MYRIMVCLVAILKSACSMNWVLLWVFLKDLNRMDCPFLVGIDVCVTEVCVILWFAEALNLLDSLEGAVPNVFDIIGYS